MLFVVTLGGLVGVVLFNASPRGLFPHALLYRLLNWVVNMGRSLPFLVLMAAIIPFTYWLTGTTIGIPAAGRCRNRRRRPFFKPSGGERAAAFSGGHRGGRRLRRIALANHCQRASSNCRRWWRR